MPSRPTLLLAGLGETGAELARRLSAHLPVVAVEIDPAVASALAETEPGNDNLRVVAGDATSALVLRRTGLDALLAAVACTSTDEANLEFLRVAAEVFGVAQRVALEREPAARPAYEAAGVTSAPRGKACAALLERSLERGRRQASGVGLGQGEIIEVEVMPHSLVVGKHLAELHPRRWLVGAVYRDGRLIVPHGDTVLEAGDRLLVVGEPDILNAVADLIRSVGAEFPLQNGTHVVALCGEDVPVVLDEAAWLVKNTRADKFEAIACDVPEDALDALAQRCSEAGIPYEFSCSAETTDDSLVDEAQHRDVGVLILAPEPLPFLARVGLGRTRTARVIDLVSSPVLIARGRFPYRKVLLALAELPFHSSAAQLALDLVRLVGAELTLAVVHHPELVVGPGYRADMEARRREVESLAGIHHVPLTVKVLEGNPVAELLSLGSGYDLVVLPYQRRRKTFLTRPDVAMNLIHRLPSSVMVLPHD